MAEVASRAHGVLVGPGLGREYNFFEQNLETFEQSVKNKLVVFDADSLWHLVYHHAEKSDLDDQGAFFIDHILKALDKNKNEVVLTPNCIEAARLLWHLEGREGSLDPSKIEKIHEICFEKYQKDQQGWGNNELLAEVQSEEILSQSKEFEAFLALIRKYSNLTVVLKGKVDVIISGSDPKKVSIVGVEGSLKRCGGIGDLLSGLICQLGFFSRRKLERAHEGVILASILTRLVSRHSYEKYTYALTAQMLLNELPYVVHRCFEGLDRSQKL